MMHATRRSGLVDSYLFLITRTNAQTWMRDPCRIALDAPRHLRINPRVKHALLHNSNSIPDSVDSVDSMDSLGSIQRVESIASPPSTDTEAHDQLVPIKEHDYLDQDPPIRGQKYACVSFVSPEDVLADKDAFTFWRFLRGVGRDIAHLLDNVDAQFGEDPELAQTVRMVRERHAYLWSDEGMQTELRSFRSVHGEDLDDAFRKQRGSSRVTVRGLKIRGVYDSVDDASARAKAIKKFDDKFNVYIAEIGCWCPWNPNPDAVASAEYAETQLNTLMKSYKDDQESRDVLYETRKHDMMSRMSNERETWLQMQQEDERRRHTATATTAADATTDATTDAAADATTGAAADATTDAAADATTDAAADATTDAAADAADATTDAAADAADAADATTDAAADAADATTDAAADAADATTDAAADATTDATTDAL
jgi:hypothetical protein